MSPKHKTPFLSDDEEEIELVSGHYDGHQMTVKKKAPTVTFSQTDHTTRPPLTTTVIYKRTERMRNGKRLYRLSNT